MATVKAANVTKYEAGGSGDNIISDGYIKTVEKVWIDSYAVSGAIATTTSILIGKVPKGKKITDIIVYLPVLSGVGTTGFLNCGTAVVHNLGTTGSLGFLKSYAGIKTITSLATESTVRLGPTGALQEVTADSDIYIMIDANGGAGTTETGGTIRTIVKYT
jgi:hypothetical protein